VLEALDADAVRRWGSAAVEQLAVHRSEIDALNVYPVPDSDTGSNLLTTVRAATAELAGRPAADLPHAAAALAALAAGAAHGALGNSGFIVSQILRGFADAAAARPETCDAAVVAAGLHRGANLARTAVVTPVEGTVLTVARAAADGAHGDTLAAVATSAVRAADAALQQTPGQLAELARAGVVDAGGRGLVVLLAALAATVTGEWPELTPVRTARRAGSRVRETGAAEFGFEVQYLLDLPDPTAQDALAKLRHALADLGDSVAVVAAGEGVWNVHAHVNDVGAAIEAGVDAGRPHQISVVRFADAFDAAAGALVAVEPGAGLAHLFEAEGARVVEGADGRPPTVDDVVAAIRATGGAEVVLLPDITRVAGVAEAAARRVREEGVRASVVPTRSPVQGLAAIAVHDPARRFDDDVVAMAEAAAATRYAHLAIARDQALTAVGICAPGDVLGLIDGEVVEIGRGLLAVAFIVVDRLLGVGAELLTVLVGAEAPARAGELIEAHVRGRSPLTDVTVYRGNQAEHPVIIGVE
jgi:DAK2 domain fusion protein YloV